MVRRHQDGLHLSAGRNLHQAGRGGSADNGHQESIAIGTRVGDQNGPDVHQSVGQESGRAAQKGVGKGQANSATEAARKIGGPLGKRAVGERSLQSGDGRSRTVLTKEAGQAFAPRGSERRAAPRRDPHPYPPTNNVGEGSKGDAIQARALRVGRRTRNSGGRRRFTGGTSISSSRAQRKKMSVVISIR
jgi:hypothetical protein